MPSGNARKGWSPRELHRNLKTKEMLIARQQGDLPLGRKQRKLKIGDSNAGQDQEIRTERD